MVALIPMHYSFNWRSLDPHYDYGHKSDDKSVEASDDKKDKAARELSPTTDFKPKRWENLSAIVDDMHLSSS